MYDYIIGKVAEISPTTLILDNSGIGYSINISLQTFSSIGSQEEAKIFIHQYLVRDDLPILYGFYTKPEREMFRLLVSVSGVGANTARMILSTFSIEDLVLIISTGNSVTLKSVKGLGVKTSEKVIVELRDKVSEIEASQSDSVTPKQSVVVDNELYDEALSALIMLGFNKTASAKVVKGIIADNIDLKVEQIIRLALKKM